MNYFVHPHALCESTKIGSGTRIWAFSHILPGARIGCDCNVCDQVFIENDVQVGNRVTIKCGVQLWDGLRVEDNVFIGPNVTFTNDPFPRSKQYPASFSQTILRTGASIGANATILPGLTIGANAMVGAGSVVTRTVPPNAIVKGNPAKITGYVDTGVPKAARGDLTFPENQPVKETRLKGVTIHTLRNVTDLRGNLLVGEFERDIPFKPLRYFLVHDVPTSETRGEHAHFRCHQFLIVVKGSVNLVVDDGKEREEFLFNSSAFGLYIPPMIWGIQYQYTSDAILLVFASDYYDSDDYIRDYDEFCRRVSTVLPPSADQ